jgi:hypothetical protein
VPSAGSFISPLIKLAVTVGTLAAVYLFIVKPVLDTTNETIDKFNAPIQRSVELSTDSVSDVVRQTQQQRLLACVQRAAGEVDRLQACQRRFLPSP